MCASCRYAAFTTISATCPLLNYLRIPKAFLNIRKQAEVYPKWILLSNGISHAAVVAEIKSSGREAATHIRERGRAECDLAVKSPKNGPETEKTSDVGEGTNVRRVQTAKLSQRPLRALGRTIGHRIYGRRRALSLRATEGQATRIVTPAKAGAHDSARSRPSPGRRK